MNTKNKIWKQIARVTGTLAALAIVLTSTGAAHARILFEDDVFDVQSETLQLDANGDATGDIGIDFGTNGSILFDGTDTFDYSASNVTTTGDTTTGGLNATGDVDFSTATSFNLLESSGDPYTCTVTEEGEIYYDTAADSIKVCTSTGWVEQASATAAQQSLDETYDVGTPGDQTVTLDDGSVIWNLASTDDFIIEDNGTTFATFANDGTVTFTGDFQAGSVTDGTYTLGTVGAQATTNASNIATNTSDISSNTTAIGTNTTNIGTNASDITALDTRVTTNEGDISSLQTTVTGLDGTDDQDLGLSGTSVTITDGTSVDLDPTFATNAELTTALGGLDTTDDDLSDNVINDLSNVNATASSGQVLEWNGSTWVAGDKTVDTDDQTAAEVSITDADTYYTATDVEGALQEIGAAGYLTSADLSSYTQTTDIDTETELEGVLTDVSNVFTNNDTIGEANIDAAVSRDTESVAAGDVAGSLATGYTINADAVSDAEIDYANVTLADFTNDAGFLTGYTETQDLSLVSDNLSITGGSTIDLSGYDQSTGVSTNATAITNLQGAVGASDEASIDYSSNNYVADATDTVTAIGALDTAIGSVSGSLNNFDVLTFNPEYPNSIVTAIGGANKGTLESKESGSSNVYEWSTNKTDPQDITLQMQFQVPADATQIDTITLVQTGTVELSASVGGTDCNGGVASTTGSLTCNIGSLTGSETVEVVINLEADSDAATPTSTAGTLSVGYTN